ncbi:hypothetical protein Rhow_000713 [Rhodococcus wratislaviensis]|uniref:Uncharacterized protein n=1 Tax=Rhodococcus wratislaviensis TaxID=44752 RepID=A0A402CML4_RHOWR|nr:hypothetical protein Rhow_000713 [Rhodococcus wratislaviensis]
MYTTAGPGRGVSIAHPVGRSKAHAQEYLDEAAGMRTTPA